MWTDRITHGEAEYTEEACRALEQAPWAAPLLRRIRESGGIDSAPKSLLFEARIAYALHTNGHCADYEFPSGSGAKSVDFRVEGEPTWLIEIVSLMESEAVKNATHGDSLFVSVVLSSLSFDPRQSEEGEVVRAIERIAEKGEKFPTPSAGVCHVVLVDMRGYGIGMADRDDFREIAAGAQAVREECQHYWQGRPVLGLFDTRNTRPSAQLIQNRVHYLGFVNERRYCESEIQRAGFYLANPQFFSNTEQVAAGLASFPLRSRGRLKRSGL